MNLVDISSAGRDIHDRFAILTRLVGRELARAFDIFFPSDAGNGVNFCLFSLASCESGMPVSAHGTSPNLWR